MTQYYDRSEGFIQCTYRRRFRNAYIILYATREIQEHTHTQLKRPRSAIKLSPERTTLWN